jgi:hypothetical protein
VLGSIDRLGTVPALEVDGQRVKTNRAISRFLDELRPDPPLFPADGDRRRAVEEAERWGDDVFQMAARRVVLTAAVHGPDMLINRSDDGRLRPLLWRSATVRLVGARMIGLFVFDAKAGNEAESLVDTPPRCSTGSTRDRGRGAERSRAQRRRLHDRP